jgi:hypothetical protein
MTAQHGEQQGGTLATASAETIARAGEVLAWLVEGVGRAEIHARARDRWAISGRQADRLIHHARVELVAGMDQERSDMRALLLTRCDAIYRAAMACQNHGAALGALNTCARLAQL